MIKWIRRNVEFINLTIEGGQDRFLYPPTRSFILWCLLLFNLIYFFIVKIWRWRFGTSIFH